MKNKIYILLLISGAAITLALTLLSEGVPNLIPIIFSFPFDQIAGALRALSGAGNIGNGFAIMLTAALGLVPAVLALIYPWGKGKQFIPERVALALFGVLLPFGIYAFANIDHFVNPVFLSVSGKLGEDFRPIAKATVGVFLWSVALLHPFFLLVRFLRTGTKEQLYGYLSPMVAVTGLAFDIGLFLSLGKLINTLKDSEMTGPDVLAFFTRSLPNLLAMLFDLLIVIKVLGLISAIREEDREGICLLGDRVCKLCMLALAVSVSAVALDNGIQFALMRQLSDVNMHFDLPLGGLLFAAAVLLVTEILVENRKLKDDNDLFI
ncbi:MAG: hypothetical protein K6F63_02540 [Lachnospiraceae bacterium]|nr:hypothetical protein [Lachnospiraceae bacterium]